MRKINIISVFAIICILLLKVNAFASYNLIIETKSDSDNYAIGETVKINVEWGTNMQAAGFTLRYNSTKLSFVNATISKDYYSISEPNIDETSGESFSDIKIKWATLDEINTDKLTFVFKALSSGNTDISITEASEFSNEDLESPEQIDYTTKGKKTIKINYIGDVCLDGKIDTNDYIYLRNYVYNNIELNDEALINADVCKDGEINRLDVSIFEKYLNGWAISFPFIYGDVDCDGMVTIRDASILQQYNMNTGNFELSREGLNRADVNLDGKVDDYDRIVIQRHLGEWENYIKLPIIIQKNIDGELSTMSIKDSGIAISGFDSSKLEVSSAKEKFSDVLDISIYNANNEKLDNNKLLATGNKIKIDEKTLETVSQLYAGVIQEYTSIIYGDTTGDGRINAIDALALIKDVNKKISFQSEIYRQAGRIVTSNGQNPTAVDALAIIKAANGKYIINQNK